MKRISLNLIVFVALCGCDVPVEDGATPGVGTGAELPSGLEPGVAGEPAPQAIPRLEPTPVESIDELPGDYYRPFSLPGQVSYLSLGPVSSATGEYSLFRSCGVPVCVPESGTFHAVPENPAVGFAFLQLEADVSGVVDTYILDYLWRDAQGVVIAVQMRRLMPGDTTGAAVVMFRMPDDPDDNDQPDEEPGEPVAERQAIELLAAGGAPSVVAAAGAEPAPGLASVYVRPLPIPGEFGALTLSQPSWAGARGVGEYQAMRPYCLPWCFPELGRYEIEIANPLTGTGWLTLRSGSDPARAMVYVIDGIWRNPIGDIVALQLQRTYDGGLVGAPFFIYRQWWDVDSIDAQSLPDAPSPPQALATPASDAALCTYYRQLEEYYAIRALQCAYSVCYPLSPWYGYWANHYHGLAEAVCDDGVE